MSDFFFKDPPQDAEHRAGPVDSLAARALSFVASQDGPSSGTVATLYLDMLVNAAQDPDRHALAHVTSHLISAGIRAEQIADRYIPAAARKLGELWNEDQLGFIAVTVGTARLMVLLRDLGAEWRADKASDVAGPTLLVLVAANVSHTLGATVLAGQLRRRGASVRLMVGARPDDVGPLIRQMRFDTVMIAASLGESLESMRSLVDAVRMSVASPPPVVLGGTITMTPGLSWADIVAQTGVDLVTNEPGEALSLCGMTSTRQGIARRGAKI